MVRVWTQCLHHCRHLPACTLSLWLGSLLLQLPISKTELWNPPTTCSTDSFPVRKMQLRNEIAQNRNSVPVIISAGTVVSHVNVRARPNTHVTAQDLT